MGGKMERNLIWHPYTQMYNASPPIFVTKAQGIYLYDQEGKMIMDAISSWWVNLHGHAHPYIAKKIQNQAKILEHVIFAGFTHKPACELAIKLIRMLPSEICKIFYSDNGSTAVEIALKMAFQYWVNKGKDKKFVISFKGSFHGETFGAMSASGKNPLHKPFWDFLFETKTIDAPTSGKEESSLEELKTILRTKKAACFIYEPLILGVGGMKIYSESILKEMILLCQNEDVLTIADEVMTGFGRTENLFASPFPPDIICLSKGLTGGFLPLGVTASNMKIFEAFYGKELHQAFLHGHSYTANPLSCASASASIDLLLKKKCGEQRKMISEMHKSFCFLFKNNSKIKRIESLGTILVIEMSSSETSYFQPLRETMYEFFLKKNILLRPLGNVLYVMPPYCIQKEELYKIYADIEEFIT